MCVEFTHGTQKPPCSLGSQFGSDGLLAGGTAVAFQTFILACNSLTMSEIRRKN